MNRLEYLYNKCIRGLAGPEEQAELIDGLGDPQNEPEARELLARAFRDEKQLSDMAPENARSIMKAILDTPRHDQYEDPKPAFRPYVFLKKWWVAAAAVFLLVSGYYLKFQRQPGKEIISANLHPPVSSNIVPGANKAILKLANGTAIILDSAANGVLARQGNTQIKMLGDGQLAYNALNHKPKEIVYNELLTPRGGQFRLTLPDGSQVWLNASSSIIYPTAFTGAQRKVEIKGEAYFEIAKNASMPFHVKVNNLDVEVLGTHFNINAYADESSIKTTLLEGAVKVGNGSLARKLSPGQQAQVDSSGAIKVVSNADLEAAIAWKNGLFHFNNTSLQNLMRQIARWYDVDIEYRGAIPPREFGGEISRNSEVSEVLKILELSKVHFEIEGKKIIVMP